MSKPSWAAIVQKPAISGYFSQNMFEECLPTNVIVPEPPMPNAEVKVCPEKSFSLMLQEIDQQMSKIDEEAEQKSDKFHKSYAYTRFSQEMDALKNARMALEEKEKNIKRAIILSESVYSKRVLDVMRKIKSYLGPAYEDTYTGYSGIKSMTYSYSIWPSYRFHSENGEGLKVNVMDAMHVDSEFPNKIDIHFQIQSDEMIPVLDAAIHEHLKGFVRDDTISLYPTNTDQSRL